MKGDGKDSKCNVIRKVTSTVLVTLGSRDSRIRAGNIT
jgi:hypothetical protein